MKNKIIKRILFCMCTIFFASLVVPIEGRASNKDIKLTHTDQRVEASLELQNDVLSHSISNYEEELEYEEFDVPYNDFKSYMPYQINGKSIFSESSKQYQLQENAYTSVPGLRSVNGYWCVAIGTGYKNVEIGDYAEAILENDIVIPIIVADIKADIHTDSSNRITIHDNSAIEFIVDLQHLDEPAKRMGDISYLTETYQSPVIKLRFYNRNYFSEHSEEMNEEN